MLFAPASLPLRPSCGASSLCWFLFLIQLVLLEDVEEEEAYSQPGLLEWNALTAIVLVRRELSVKEEGRVGSKL